MNTRAITVCFLCATFFFVGSVAERIKIYHLTRDIEGFLATVAMAGICLGVAGILCAVSSKHNAEVSRD